MRSGNEVISIPPSRKGTQMSLMSNTSSVKKLNRINGSTTRGGDVKIDAEDKIDEAKELKDKDESL